MKNTGWENVKCNSYRALVLHVLNVTSFIFHVIIQFYCGTGTQQSVKSGCVNPGVYVCYEPLVFLQRGFKEELN